MGARRAMTVAGVLGVAVLCALPVLSSGGQPLAGLSTRQLAGQRLMVAFTGHTPPAALVSAIGRGEVAGVILYTGNVVSVADTRRLVDRLQGIPRPVGLRAPLLIAVDQEGGEIRRFAGEPPERSASAMGAAESTAQIQRVGAATAKALRRAGVNVNLAPVADIAHTGSEMAREGRTFGSSKKAAAFARGLVGGGVQATAKHFPGLGGATENTDLAPVSIGLSKGTLRTGDERAFVPVIAAGARLVMLANAIYPALDPTYPASQSRAIVSGELRGRLAFDGVTITDDLGAAALKRFGAAPALAVRAAQAGVDIELFGSAAIDPVVASASARAALTQAIGTGAIRRADAVAAAQRVLALRASLSASP